MYFHKKRILASAKSGEKVDYSKNPQKQRFWAFFGSQIFLSVRILLRYPKKWLIYCIKTEIETLNDRLRRPLRGRRFTPYI